MSVGKTPQITKDFVIPSNLSFIGSDITSTAVVYDTYESLPISTQTGTYKDVVNINFDSINPAFTANFVAQTGTMYNTIYLDLKKSYKIRSVTYRMVADCTNFVNVSTNHIDYVNEVPNGSNQISTPSKSYTNIGGNVWECEVSATFITARFLNLTMNIGLNNSTGSIKLYRVFIILDDYQTQA